VNRGWTYRSAVAGARPGETVVDYLVRRFPHGDPREWRERIAAGRVRLDGRPVAHDDLVRDGEELAWHRPPWVEPDAPSGFDVVHEDAGLVVVAKPAGLPTLPGGGFLENTLLHRVRGRFPDARPMHRLGRWTSGLVVFARGADAQRHLAAAFRSGTVHKRYRALVSGDPARERFDVAVPIGPVPHDVLGSVHAACAAGRPARSEVVVLERHRDRALVDVVIATGRPHQIRIHLAAAGHPLCGDPLYAAGGLPRPGTTALPGDPGYLLHAAEIGFVAPDGSPRSFRLDPPPTLRTAEES